MRLLQRAREKHGRLGEGILVPWPATNHDIFSTGGIPSPRHRRRRTSAHLPSLPCAGIPPAKIYSRFL